MNAAVVLCLFLGVCYAERCSRGFFLNSQTKKCVECLPRTWQDAERHSNNRCNMCSKCKPGTTAVRECTPVGDVVCECLPPFAERDGKCLLYHAPTTPPDN